MLVDASPLIYLAKIDVLDVFAGSGHEPLVTPEVERETARSGLAYEHPDSLVIAEALRTGVLSRTELDHGEPALAERLFREAGGIDRGEAEALAVAATRRQAILLFERRATQLAKSMAIETWTPVELLFAGTAEKSLLTARVERFAELVDMRLADVRALLSLIRNDK